MGRLPVVLVLVVLGCGRAEPPAADRALQTQGSWVAQIAAVRAGRTSRIEVDRPPGPEEWESLRGLPGLRELVLRAGVVDDSRAGLLATLPDIERLVLRASPLSDAGLRALAAAMSLRDLNVPQADCTAAGIRALARLGNLRSLRLGGVRAPGADVGDALATLVGLRSLHLIDVPLGDTGLEGIARLPGLGSLYLDGAGVSDGAWARYCDAHPGVHVHIDQAHHDRDPRRGHDPAPRLPPADRSGHASEETP